MKPLIDSLPKNYCIDSGSMSFDSCIDIDDGSNELVPRSLLSGAPPSIAPTLLKSPMAVFFSNAAIECFPSPLDGGTVVDVVSSEHLLVDAKAMVGPPIETTILKPLRVSDGNINQDTTAQAKHSSCGGDTFVTWEMVQEMLLPLQNEVASLRMDTRAIRGIATEIRGNVTEIRGNLTEIRADMAFLRAQIFGLACVVFFVFSKLFRLSMILNLLEASIPKSLLNGTSK